MIPMQRTVNRSLTMRGRLIALATLFAFVVGNVGWPVATGSVAGGSCCKVSGLATCCCGDKPGTKNCGCSKGIFVAQKSPAASAPAKKLPSCCQKRLEAAEKAAVVMNCACGESSTPGFVVSTQPKLTVLAVSVAELTVTGDLVPTAVIVFAGSKLAPETPPPRSSVS